MGLYLEVDSKGVPLGAKTKVERLLADGAKEIVPVTYEKNLVCVVDNGPFQAAAFMYSRQEYREIRAELAHDSRPYVWLRCRDEQIARNFRPDTLVKHHRDFIGPKSFEELDRIPI